MATCVGVICTIAALLAPLHSQQAVAPQSGLDILKVEQAGDGSLGVTVHSDATRPISAWVVKVRFTGQDGEEHVKYSGHDMFEAPAVVALGLTPLHGHAHSTFLEPGSSRYWVIGLPSGATAPAVDVAAVILDNGDCLGDVAAARPLLRQRENTAAAVDRWLPLLEEAAAAGSAGVQSSQLQRDLQAARLQGRGDDTVQRALRQLMAEQQKHPSEFPQEAKRMLQYLRRLRAEGRRHLEGRGR